jgi:hypothetical protein
MRERSRGGNKIRAEFFGRIYQLPTLDACEYKLPELECQHAVGETAESPSIKSAAALDKRY